MQPDLTPTKTFWKYPVEYWYKVFNSSPNGLTQEFAQLRRPKKEKYNWLQNFPTNFKLFISKFLNPIDLIFLFVMIFSLAMGHYRDLILIVFVLGLSGTINFLQVYKTKKILGKLDDLTSMKCSVIRSNVKLEIPKSQLVQGDIIQLFSGDIVPADCLIVSSSELLIDESRLTGEADPKPKSNLTDDKQNCLWEGTSVVSGSGTAIVINLGIDTEFEKNLKKKKTMSDTIYDKWIGDFGYFLIGTTAIFAISYLAISILLKREFFQSFLFAWAIAAGIAPDLIPAISSLSKALVANKLIGKKVLVKNLQDIELLSEIDILCFDMSTGGNSIQVIDGEKFSEVRKSIGELAKLNIKYKILSEDTFEIVNKNLESLEIISTNILSGSEISVMDLNELRFRVNDTEIFVGLNSTQKEEIVNALQPNQKVGYLGNGIGDIVAMKSADVALAVENSIDLVSDATDIILPDVGFAIVPWVITECRKSGTNTLKYIFIRIGGNFGTMLSIAIGTFVFPFLPMMPVQIFLMNILSNIPLLAISSDFVDDSDVLEQDKWENKIVRNHMIIFGLFVTAYHLITFIFLFAFLRLSESEFQTSWFVQTTICELAIIFVLRTKKEIFKSRPSMALIVLAMIAFIALLKFPHSPLARYFGLTQIPFGIVLYITIASILFILISEQLKVWFYRKVK